jgi:hypothetical protein
MLRSPLNKQGPSPATGTETAKKKNKGKTITVSRGNLHTNKENTQRDYLIIQRRRSSRHS